MNNNESLLNQVKKIDNKIKIFTIGFVIILLFQILFIIYSNITFDAHKINTDVTGFLELAKLMWEQKKIFVDNWSYQTTLMIDSPVLIASLLYGVTNNIYLSFGVSSLIIVLGSFCVIYSILKHFNISFITKIIVLNVVLTPLSLGELGYFTMYLSAYAPYSVKILTALLILKCILNLNEDNKLKSNKLLYISTCLLTFLCAISSSIYVFTTVILGILLFNIVRVFVYNDIKILRSDILIYIYILTFITILGVLISSSLVDFQSRSSGMNIILSGDFINNFFYVIQGFIELFEGLPVQGSVAVLSKEGIIHIARLGIVLFIGISIVYYTATTIKNSWAKDENNNEKTVLFIFYVTVILYTIINTSYGQPYFETRYLIIATLCVLPLGGKLVECIISSNKTFFRNTFLLGMLAVLTVVNVFGYTVALNERFVDVTALTQLKNEMDKLDVDLVYFYGLDSQGDAQSIRGVEDTSRIYDCIFEDNSYVNWGNRTDNRKQVEIDQGIALIVTKGSFEQVLSSYIRSHFEYVKTINNYDIYYSNKNVISFADAVPTIVGDSNMIYPYSIGMQFSEGKLTTEGTFITSDIGGCVMWGPYAQLAEGEYRVELKYEVLQSTSDEVGRFEIAVDAGNKIQASSDIDIDSSSVILDNIVIKNTSVAEYKLFTTPGAKLKINSIEITRIK